jgi:hypothetical protein
MPNIAGNAYGLTTLCPIKNGGPQRRADPAGNEMPDNRSHGAIIRDRLEDLPCDEDSPMARVANTYLCRFYVLDDVIYQGKPAEVEHLKSKYLVFTSNFHGELDTYLHGMWENAGDDLRRIWEYCVAFEQVDDTESFTEYIKKCQVYTTFFFMGSTDVSLAEQLKGLYLKQEFSKFAFANQGKSAEETQAAFSEFVARTQPEDLCRPTWRPGASSLHKVVIECS